MFQLALIDSKQRPCKCPRSEASTHQGPVGRDRMLAQTVSMRAKLDAKLDPKQVNGARVGPERDDTEYKADTPSNRGRSPMDRSRRLASAAQPDVFSSSRLLKKPEPTAKYCNSVSQRRARINHCVKTPNCVMRLKEHEILRS